MRKSDPLPTILELRVAVTADDLDMLARFYLDGLGLEPSQEWPQEQGRSVVLDLGRATLELFDEKQAETVDLMEVGHRISGKIRFALEVPDLDRAIERLVGHGAKLVHDPVDTPWGDRVARFEDPGGMQITLYQSGEDS